MNNKPITPARRRPSKYGAVPTGGHASRKEHRRARELHLMQRAGLISGLREQVPFTLIPSQFADEVVDAICDPHNSDYDKYDDTPHFLTLETLRPILSEIQGWHDTIDMTADELIKEIENKYNE